MNAKNPSRSLRVVADAARLEGHVAPGELEDLLRSFRRSAFRLETLDDYSEGLEDEDYRSWCRVDPPSPIHGHWWYDGIVRASASTQRRWDRVHMLRQSSSTGAAPRYGAESRHG